MLDQGVNIGFLDYGSQKVFIDNLTLLVERDESKVHNLDCNNKAGKHNKFL